MSDLSKELRVQFMSDQLDEKCKIIESAQNHLEVEREETRKIFNALYGTMPR